MLNSHIIIVVIRQDKISINVNSVKVNIHRICISKTPFMGYGEMITAFYLPLQ